MKEALYYEKESENRVRCLLCPHHCLIRSGRKGICQVRENRNGHLFSLNYGVISSAALDPIEKKPLYNFMPGTQILSIGSIGCNLSCDFCQNWQIASSAAEAITFSEKEVEPLQIVEEALRLRSAGNIGVAYTYNEPTVWFEYMKEIAALAQAAELKNVLVSNGYIEAAPLSDLLSLIDAFNIDLKSYSNQFYADLARGSLPPVLRTLEQIALNGNHLEIAYLVIPGKNDDPVAFGDIVQWISERLGQQVSLHINRYFPCHRMNLPPTSRETLEALADVARAILPHVYLGNI